MADFIPSNNFRAFDQVQDNGSCKVHKFQSDIKKLRRASEASLTRSRSLARTENIENEVMAERVASDLV